MKKFFETPFGKGLLTILRNAVIVVLGFVVSELINLIPGIEMNETAKVVVIALLKLIDEGLHKTGIAVKGITRF